MSRRLKRTLSHHSGGSPPKRHLAEAETGIGLFPDETKEMIIADDLDLAPSTDFDPDKPSTSSGPAYESSDPQFKYQYTSPSLSPVSHSDSDDNTSSGLAFPPTTPDMVDESIFMQLRNLDAMEKLPMTAEEVLNNPSVPFLGLQQTKSLIKSVVDEHERKLINEFETTLKERIKEQRHAYVKFSQDQVQRRLGMPPNPSYMS